jgi:hypothetical protein
VDDVVALVHPRWMHRRERFPHRRFVGHLQRATPLLNSQTLASKRLEHACLELAPEAFTVCLGPSVTLRGRLFQGRCQVVR